MPPLTSRRSSSSIFRANRQGCLLLKCCLWKCAARSSRESALTVSRSRTRQPLSSAKARTAKSLNFALFVCWQLWPRLENQVEWCLCGAAESREAAARHNLAQALLSRLRPQSQSNFLRQRGRRAQKCGRAVKRAANGIEIVLEFVARERLYDHPRSVLLEPAVYVRGSPRGIAHIVQAIEEGHEVVVFAWKRFRAGHFKLDAVAHAGITRALLGRFD